MLLTEIIKAIFVGQNRCSYIFAGDIETLSKYFVDFFIISRPQTCVVGIQTCHFVLT